MSQENVDLVRRAINHLNETGEPEWNLYASDLVWTTRRDGPATSTIGASTASGAATLPCAKYGRKSRLRSSNWSKSETQSFRCSIGAFVRKAASNSKRGAWVTWCRDGKIARIEQHEPGTKPSKPWGCPSSPKTGRLAVLMFVCRGRSLSGHGQSTLQARPRVADPELTDDALNQDARRFLDKSWQGWLRTAPRNADGTIADDAPPVPPLPKLWHPGRLRSAQCTASFARRIRGKSDEELAETFGFSGETLSHASGITR